MSHALGRLAATALALAILAATLASQTVTVVFDGHSGTVDGNGFAKLELGDSWRGDFAVQWPEVVVLNGAVENYCGPGGITGDLVVAVDGVAVHFEKGVRIYDACGHVVYLEDLVYAPTEAGRTWLDWYSAGGPELNQAWAPGVTAFAWGGPNPDPVDAGSTGSGRVAWLRWPLGMAIEMQRNAGLAPTQAQWQEVQRWAAAQWDRAYHAYYAEQGYRRWEAWEDPDAIMGQGYRSWGGFWDTYSSTELHGRTHLSPGKKPPDEQHADISGLVWTAAATGSWAAKTSAAMLIEARYSFPPFDGSTTWSVSVRELGWVGRCLALYYGLTGETWCLRYIDRLEHILDAAGGEMGERFWNHLDRASTSYNGYVWLSPAVQSALVEYGEDPSDPKKLVGQTSGWQSAILGITEGLMAEALVMQKAPGWELRASGWNRHEIVTAVLILVNLRAPGFDNASLVWRAPMSVSGFPMADGLAPRVLVNRVPSSSYLVGTGLVTIGFAEQFGRRHPMHAEIAHGFADLWVDYLVGHGYIDKGWIKANLDRLYLSAGRRGWLAPTP
ncbi:MAG: hypothetical protein DRH08_00895 [Deltaproteobacteria bacterium]|nr:MAG: hypothetical protein DRH08_00895 [Deltaproteobacteria bacterium]